MSSFPEHVLIVCIPRERGQNKASMPRELVLLVLGTTIPHHLRHEMIRKLLPYKVFIQPRLMQKIGKRVPCATVDSGHSHSVNLRRWRVLKSGKTLVLRDRVVWGTPIGYNFGLSPAQESGMQRAMRPRTTSVLCRDTMYAVEPSAPGVDVPMREPGDITRAAHQPKLEHKRSEAATPPRWRRGRHLRQAPGSLRR